MNTKFKLKNFSGSLLGAIICLFGVSSAANNANKKLSDSSKNAPKFEIGLGLADLYVPNYPGSKEFKNYLLPFPYAYYKGDWIEADRDKGIRSKIFENASIELSISFSGSLPVDSSDNKAREGMENLDWIYEFGPNLVYTFPEWKGINIHFQIPLRLVSTTNLSNNTKERGVLFNPKVVLRKNVSCSNNCLWELQIGGEAASKKLHSYFYQVPSKNVTSERSEYNAKAGYISNFLLLKYRVSNSKWRYGINFRYNDYKENANTDSPLFTAKDSFAVSLFWAVKLWDSNDKWTKHW